jgi:hypothetical protein
MCPTEGMSPSISTPSTNAQASVWTVRCSPVRSKSANARRLIREWAALHRAEIEANWARMEAGEQLERIEPLE